MHKKVSVSVPAKLILIGEHTVVYNQPALATSLDMRLNVDIQPADKFIISSNTDKDLVINVKFLTNKLSLLDKTWQQYDLNGNFQPVKDLLRGRAMLLQYSIILTLKKLDLLQTKNKFRLTTISNIPSGSGLGSSAAICVASVAAILKFYNSYDEKLLKEIVDQLEKYQHGHPSGVDVASVIQGGVVYFQKNPAVMNIQKIDLDFLNKQNVFLINTGKPQESTGEMVAKVAQLKLKNPSLVEKINQDQGELTNRLLSVLTTKNISEIRKIIKLSENNLEKLEVVSRKTKNFIQEINLQKGVAKICGAGGYVKGSGMVISLFLSYKDVFKIAKKYGFKIYSLKFTSKGLLFS